MNKHIENLTADFVKFGRTYWDLVRPFDFDEGSGSEWSAMGLVDMFTRQDRTEYVRFLRSIKSHSTAVGDSFGDDDYCWPDSFDGFWRNWITGQGCEKLDGYNEFARHVLSDGT